MGEKDKILLNDMKVSQLNHIEKIQNVAHHKEDYFDCSLERESAICIDYLTVGTINVERYRDILTKLKTAI